MNENETLARLDGSVVSPQHLATVRDEARREVEQIMREEQERPPDGNTA